MTRWPWVTGVLVVIVAALPLTHDIFYSAFISSERWMQDFWQFVVWVGVATAVLLGFIEWGIRTIMVRRRARVLAAGSHKTES